MRLVQIVCIGFILLLSSVRLWGQASPLGNWITIDDVTGKTKSVVSLLEEDGKLVGIIRKVYDPSHKDGPADM